MKQNIEQWLKENTVLIRAHDGTMMIALPQKLEFSAENHQDYQKIISDVASELAAHIENARTGH